MGLLDLCGQVGLNPVRVSGTHGGEFHCGCPGCGGKDRFRIHPHKRTKQGMGTYDCRQCGIGGNTVTFAMQFCGYSYPEALDAFADNYHQSERDLLYLKPDPKPVEIVQGS